MREPARINFVTRSGLEVVGGIVLSFDDYLSLPLRVEYRAPNGDKRIERFHPDEFKSGGHHVSVP